MLARFEQTRQRRYLFLAVVFAASAALTRTIGIAVIVAIVASLFLHNRRDKWRASAVAVIPWLAWSILSTGERSGYLGTLATKLAHDQSAGLHILLIQQLNALADGWRVNIAGAGFSAGVAQALGMVCIAASGWRLIQKKADGFFVFAYIGILLAWPFPAERVRFMMPLVPVLMGQLILVSARMRFTLGKGTYSIVPMIFIAFALTALPNLVMAVSHYREPLPAESAWFRHNPAWYELSAHEQRLDNLTMEARFTQSMRELSARVPAGDCIYGIKPALIGLFANRVSHRTPLPERGIVARANCRFVYMVPFASPTYRELFYPLDAWADRISLLQAFTLVPDRVESPVIGVLAEIRRSK
jgi:hypothetical protein